MSALGATPPLIADMVHCPEKCLPPKFPQCGRTISITPPLSIGDYQPDWQSCRAFCASAHPLATWFQHEFDEGPFTNDVGREGEGGGYQKFDAVREVASFLYYSLVQNAYKWGGGGQGLC